MGASRGSPFAKIWPLRRSLFHTLWPCSSHHRRCSRYLTGLAASRKYCVTTNKASGVIPLFEGIWRRRFRTTSALGALFTISLQRHSFQFGLKSPQPRFSAAPNFGPLASLLYSCNSLDFNFMACLFGLGIPLLFRQRPRGQKNIQIALSSF